MSQPDEDTEKEHEPTQKKLDDARSKGDFAKSVDLTTAAAYGGLLIAMLALGAQTFAQLGTVLASLIDRADTLSTLWFSENGTVLAGALMTTTAKPLAIWFAIPAAAALVSIIAQQAFVVAPDKLNPRLSRLSLIANAKNKFGRAGLFEFAKSFAKLTIYSVALGVFLFRRFDVIVATAQYEPATALVVLGQLAVQFMGIVFIVAAAIGTIDLIFQKQEHIRKNRMSRKELTDEAKQTEGDPHMKQQRRQRGIDIAMNRMLEDVPEADVVIVNPTHYAVALKWSRMPGSAPECVAKGVDEVAAKIREIASEAGVPIHSDPPTARALYASVEIGEEIRPDHYKAVAAAIRFAEAMRQKAKAPNQ